MKTIKGPALFLAQFAGDAAPFNSLTSIAQWAGGLGYKGIQMPSWDGRLFDLQKAAESKDYCQEVQGTLAQHGLRSVGQPPGQHGGGAINVAGFPSIARGAQGAVVQDLPVARVIGVGGV